MNDDEAGIVAELATPRLYEELELARVCAASSRSDRIPSFSYYANPKVNLLIGEVQQARLLGPINPSYREAQLVLCEYIGKYCDLLQEEIIKRGGTRVPPNR